jgi:GTPase SAR1 family protein
MTFSVVFLGDCRVGKTTIINLIRGIGDVAPYPTKMPSQLDYTIGENTFLIKDNSGRPEYQSMTNEFIAASSIAVLVYAQDDQRSFDALAPYVAQVKKFSKKFNIQYIIVGNKKDRAKAGLAEKGAALATELNGTFIESVATADRKEGLEELKTALAEAAAKSQA